MNGNIDNKNDAREAFAKVSKDKETVTEVDDDWSRIQQPIP